MESLYFPWSCTVQFFVAVFFWAGGTTKLNMTAWLDDWPMEEENDDDDDEHCPRQSDLSRPVVAALQKKKFPSPYPTPVFSTHAEKYTNIYRYIYTGCAKSGCVFLEKRKVAKVAKSVLL